jgi:hypothetical protein
MGSPAADLVRAEKIASVTFAFEDLERRTFVALNKAADGYHLVAPADPGDVRVTGRYLRADGDVGEPKVTAGELVCSCKGGLVRGSCYVTEAALERLSVDFTADPSLGAGASVEGYRG